MKKLRVYRGLFCVVSTVGLFASSLSYAAKLEEKEIALDAPPAFTHSYTAEQFEETLKNLKELAKRKPAETQLDHIDEKTALTAQYRHIRDLFLAAKEADSDDPKKRPGTLIGLLETLDQEVKEGKFTEPDAQLLAAQLLLLKPMRGFVYRARNIFEANGRDNKFSHAAAVTLLRTTAQGIEVYLPTDQWRAGFRFAVEPYYVGDNVAAQKTCETNWTDTCDVSNGPRFQAWLQAEVLPRLNHLEDVLSSFSLKDNNKYVYADNQILYGLGNYTSDRDRLLRFGEGERLGMLAATEATISTIYGGNAFTLRHYFDAWDKVAINYGFTAAFSASRSTSETRYNAIRNNYPELFTLKGKDNRDARAATIKNFLTPAYESLKTSLQNAYLGWAYIDARGNVPDQFDNFIDPRAVVPFHRLFDTGFNNAFGAVGIDKDKKEVASGKVWSAMVRNEKVVVNLKAFYTDPPNSLQEFMPLPSEKGGFEGGEEMLNKTVNGVVVKYRNYYKGRPIAWDYKKFTKYFPEVNSSKDVERTSRVLAQSWGGFVLGLPMSFVMF